MYAVVHLPEFALQAALRGTPELRREPVALVDPDRLPPKVCAVTPAARDHGVAAGLTPTQALARCAGVRIRHRSAARESEASDAVLQCAFGFSPHIESTAPGQLTLDLRGLSAVSDGTAVDLAAWGGSLRTVLEVLDLDARIGIGRTPDIARHAARAAETVRVVEGTEAFIAGLPVSALEPSTHVAEILERWGVRTVGELQALGQAEVTERLGLEALALFAAASANAVRPLRLARPVERFEEGFEFEEPVETLEPLLFLLRRFVDALCLRLEPSGRVARSVTMRLRLESGQAHERLLHVPEPTRRPDILFRMLRTHLETVRTETAVAAVALSLDPGLPAQRQFGLFESVLRDPHQFQETLARLSALLGADRVGSPVRLPGHRRDSFRLVPPDFENAPSAEPPRPDLLRPVPWRRLRPEPGAVVEVRGPDGDPLSVRCAVVNGRLRVSVGPWKASGNWWEPGAWSREDWDAQTASGAVVRLTRESGNWHVTGLLD